MRTRLALISLLLLLAAACGGNRASSGPAAPTSRSGPILTVENGTSSDYRIYAVVGTSQRMLGTIRAQRNSFLPLVDVPSNGYIRFLARPIGAATGDQDFVSETVELARDRQVTWTLRSFGGSQITYGTRP